MWTQRIKILPRRPRLWLRAREIMRGRSIKPSRYLRRKSRTRMSRRMIWRLRSTTNCRSPYRRWHGSARSFPVKRITALVLEKVLPLVRRCRLKRTAIRSRWPEPEITRARERSISSSRRERPFLSQNIRKCGCRPFRAQSRIFSFPYPGLKGSNHPSPCRAKRRSG